MPMLAHSHASAEITPLRVVAEPFAPPSGLLLDTFQISPDEALIIFDPSEMDKPQVLWEIAQRLGRPVLDMDTGEVTR